MPDLPDDRIEHTPAARTPDIDSAARTIAVITRMHFFLEQIAVELAALYPGEQAAAPGAASARTDGRFTCKNEDDTSPPPV
ncbi:hypothetical protein Varpa_0933 [Variovorax paradoxus EPS]|uniref:Uncharacterized protein n=2 Tax=Variovorax paradoxus TaxID=34073 RepID=E6VAP1_VARPE|nr:hypothetical protein Varpa_0933 [Variovorax paradoxus EPS]